MSDTKPCDFLQTRYPSRCACLPALPQKSADGAKYFMGMASARDLCRHSLVLRGRLWGAVMKRVYSATEVIAVGHDATLRAMYVSDLPGHDGLRRSRSNPNSDWGWSSDRAQAIALTAYWQRRFMKYTRDGGGFHGALFERPIHPNPSD